MKAFKPSGAAQDDQKVKQLISHSSADPQEGKNSHWDYYGLCVNALQRIVKTKCEAVNVKH